MKRNMTFLTSGKKRIILFTVLVLACFCMMKYIFNLSAMPLKESAKKSDGIINEITNMVAEKNGVAPEELPSKTVTIISNVVRKSGHFLVFALFGVLTYFLSAIVSLKNKKYWKPALFSVPFCIVYGISDEIHQLFVEGRFARGSDVVVDAAGAFVGTLVSVAAIVVCGKLYQYLRNRNGKDNEHRV